MAQYRLLEKTFINGALRDKGEIVEYDGQPGSTLQPVNARPGIDIPADWRDQNGLQRIALARSLGAPKQRLSAADADLWIQNEIDNRDLQSKQGGEPRKSLSSFKPLVPSGDETEEAKAKREADEAAAKEKATT